MYDVAISRQVRYVLLLLIGCMFACRARAF
jgi:hypothetical protein